MENFKKIDRFLMTVCSIQRDFSEWRKNPPTEKEIKKEWEVFSELLEIAQYEKIDRETIVCMNAQSVMKNFSEFLDIGAMSTI